jgi:hypothetical protein
MLLGLDERTQFFLWNLASICLSPHCHSSLPIPMPIYLTTINNKWHISVFLSFSFQTRASSLLMMVRMSPDHCEPTVAHPHLLMHCVFYSGGLYQGSKRLIFAIRSLLVEAFLASSSLALSFRNFRRRRWRLRNFLSFSLIGINLSPLDESVDWLGATVSSVQLIAIEYYALVRILLKTNVHVTSSQKTVASSFFTDLSTEIRSQPLDRLNDLGRLNFVHR